MIIALGRLSTLFQFMYFFLRSYIHPFQFLQLLKFISSFARLFSVCLCYSYLLYYLLSFFFAFHYLSPLFSRLFHLFLPFPLFITFLWLTLDICFFRHLLSTTFHHLCPFYPFCSLYFLFHFSPLSPLFSIFPHFSPFSSTYINASLHSLFPHYTRFSSTLSFFLHNLPSSSIFSCMAAFFCALYLL